MKSQFSSPTSHPPPPAVNGQLVYPLDRFYARDAVPLPPVREISGQAMPEPYRQLLVHDNDMTPTLEAWFYSDIHIEVWSRECQGDLYLREVLLRLDRDLQPVEFGANQINLALFAPDVRRLILDEYLPLGHILKMRDIPHRGHPLGYFEIEADLRLQRAFRLTGPRPLYGRRNRITDPQGRVLSDIVEILPPL